MNYILGRNEVDQEHFKLLFPYKIQERHSDRLADLIAAQIKPGKA